MLTWLPVIVTMLTTLGVAIFTPSFIMAHPMLFAVLNALAQLAHSILPSNAGVAPAGKMLVPKD